MLCNSDCPEIHVERLCRIKNKVVVPCTLRNKKVIQQGSGLAPRSFSIHYKFAGPLQQKWSHILESTDLPVLWKAIRDMRSRCYSCVVDVVSHSKSYSHGSDHNRLWKAICVNNDPYGVYYRKHHLLRMSHTAFHRYDCSVKWKKGSGTC